MNKTNKTANARLHAYRIPGELYDFPLADLSRDETLWAYGVVQPWLRGFESTFNQDFNTHTTAYVARH